jgi:tetratricopeptide (TPR) repeat protein
MKKTAITTFTLILFAISFLPGQNNEANQAYIKAMTTANPDQKAQLLKEFLNNYSGKGSQYENFANAELCLNPYRGKTPQETIKYGEKALELGGLDDLTKSRVLITLAGTYISLGQNLSKASNYASQVVQIAQANKGKESSPAPPAQWNQLIGGAYYAQGQALEKAKNLRDAVDAYINSYDILKNKQIVKDLQRVGKSLYDGKAYKDAEKALRIASSSLKDFVSLYLYANCLHKNGKTEDALSHYKQAYMKQKNGKIAYNIGILMAKKANKNATFTDEALRYLLDAAFLSQEHSKKAMQMAESLFFHSNKDLRYNEKVQEIQQKNKNLEDLTNAFNEKFGEKNEEDLSDAEKKEMEKMLSQIESEQESLKKLEADTKAALAEFQLLIDKTKQRLGIK